MKKDDIQIQFVAIDKLEYNIGQIPGVPENPRTREDDKQKTLEKSIEDLPEMTIARAALCFPFNGKYVVIGGNRRLEAQRALKKKQVPIIALPADTPVEKLRRIALVDNESTGKTDWAKLAKDWDISEVQGWGVELPVMESEIDPDDFFEQIKSDHQKDKVDKITITIPADISQQKDDMIEAIMNALKDYPGIKVR